MLLRFYSAERQQSRFERADHSHRETTWRFRVETFSEHAIHPLSFPSPETVRVIVFSKESTRCIYTLVETCSSRSVESSCFAWRKIVGNNWCNDRLFIYISNRGKIDHTAPCSAQWSQRWGKAVAAVSDENSSPVSAFALPRGKLYEKVRKKKPTSDNFAAISFAEYV